MTLQEHYKQLPKRQGTRTQLIKHIAIQCGVGTITVYRWVKGTSVPDKLKRDKVSEITGRSVEDLWPRVKELEVRSA